jgi:O-antigen/teichoic acid export membrane protein
MELINKDTVIFETKQMKHDFNGRAVRSGVATMVAQALQSFFQLGSTIVLARLLVPEDFGLIAMVVTIINFAALFKDLGLSMATVQKSEITHGQVSFLFWVNAGISLIITSITAIIAPLITYFYHDPRLLSITLILSFTFLLGGLAVQHQALLQRQMKFRQLAVIQTVSAFLGVVTAVFLAFMWHGTTHAYMALVWMQVVQAAAFTAGVWLICHWIPCWPSAGDGVRSMLKFGANITGFEVINYFSRNLDNILIGKIWGAAPLGLYAKAYQIVLFPIRNIRIPINSVALPVLSRLQNNCESFRRYYIRLVLVISVLSMPIMVFLFIASTEIIEIVFGPKWADMELLFKIMTFTGFIQAASGTKGIVILSLGYSGRYLRLGMMNAIATITGFIIGTQWGITGVAIAYAVVTYGTQIPFFMYTFRNTPVSFKDWLDGMWRVFVASLGAAGIVYLIIPSICINNVFYMLSIKALFIGISFICLFYLLPGSRRQFLFLLNTVRSHILKN